MYRGTGVLIGLGLGLAQAVAAEPARPSLEKACAALDLNAVTLIEDHGIAGTSRPADLAEAAFGIGSARAACREGEFARGLAIYERLALGRVDAALLYEASLRR